MKTTLSTTQAAHMLLDDDNANWSRAGAFALAEYLEELEEDMGNEEIEFCPCSIRCEFSEYADLQEWANEQFRENLKDQFDLDADYLPEELNDRIREYIQDRGTLIEFDGGVIVSSF
jgi:hypothetical protein